MFTKVFCLLAVVVAVSAHGFSEQHILRHDGPHQPVHVQGHGHDGHGHGGHGHDSHGHDGHVDYYAHPKYEFEYKVDDDHTGDHKSHHEHRDGHDTKSSYKVHVDHIIPHHHHY